METVGGTSGDAFEQDRNRPDYCRPGDLRPEPNFARPRICSGQGCDYLNLLKNGGADDHRPQVLNSFADQDVFHPKKKIGGADCGEVIGCDFVPGLLTPHLKPCSTGFK